MLKPLLHSLPGPLLGSALGFVCAAALVTKVSRWKVADSGFPLLEKTASPGTSALASGSQPAALPATGDFEKMPPSGKLELALQFRPLNAEQRQAFLRECLNRPLPERTPLLSLLLTLWAETQPSAAVDWIMANLQKPESSACVNDVLRTWAASDGQSLAEWANAHSKSIDREIVNNAMTALERHSPLWFARISAMECNLNTEWSGMKFDSLREPGAAKALSPQLAAQVAYSTDPAKLAKPYVEQWDAPQKWGWNRLFERTAIYWHAEDPAACDAWLDTFPENARQAARRSIEEEERPVPSVPSNPAPR